jgi:DNA-binding transcriptional ArsR family regulator
MSKGLVALLAFTITLLVATPQAAASFSPRGGSVTPPPNDLQTKVMQDAEGNVHVLWLVPSRNQSASGPGIWYSKYSPNGTDTIPTTQVSNSTTVQSADLAVDEEGNAIIVWADDIASAPAYSALFLLHFNSTQAQTTKVLTTQGSLILWPSLAIGNNASVYMTWTEYNPSSSHAVVEYGEFATTGLIGRQQIASYERADEFPPQARVVFDNSSQHLQLAWGESQRDGQSSSTVNYAKLGTNGTVLTQLELAKFGATLRDVTITAMTGHDGAFVLWQTSGSNYSLYVSQISPSGQLIYVKELNYTSGQSRYLAVSTDREDNLYVVWYQPSIVTSQNAATTVSTNVTYLRMNVTGSVIQTGAGVFKNPIIGVAVLSDGVVYGVSPEGFVSVVTPIQPRTGIVTAAALALMSCVSVASFAGSVLVEEGRYRWGALYSKIARTSTRRASSANREVLRQLARKPGLKLREIRRLTEDHPVGLISLLGMERSGFIASFRDGFSRRFYVKGSETRMVDALRTRILLWVLDHPGIWEAQVAKDLGLSQQIAHYHLKKLRETKLITAHMAANGSRKLYRFADDAHDLPDAALYE